MGNRSSEWVFRDEEAVNGCLFSILGRAQRHGAKNCTFWHDWRLLWINRVLAIPRLVPKPMNRVVEQAGMLAMALSKVCPRSSSLVFRAVMDKYLKSFGANIPRRPHQADYGGMLRLPKPRFCGVVGQ